MVFWIRQVSFSAGEVICSILTQKKEVIHLADRLGEAHYRILVAIPGYSHRVDHFRLQFTGG